MARTKQNQRSASRGSVPMGTTGGRTPPSRTTIALLVASVLSAVWAGAMLTSWGQMAYVVLFTFTEFYVGVLALVFLSITVMAGVVSTDRMVLTIRQRVLFQSAHRATGIIAVGCLGLHIMTKVSMGRVGLIDVFVPFLAANQTLFVGFGTLATYLLVAVLVTGVVRTRFIGRGKPWMWRCLHSVCYLCWPIAIVHGLTAGRAAAGWVIASYVGCVLLVTIVLVVRLSVGLGRRKDFASSTSTGGMKPVGQLVPTAAPSAKGARSRRRPERSAEVTVEPVRARVVADRDDAPAPLRSWAADERGGERRPRRAAVEEDFGPARRTGRDEQYRPSRAAGDEYRPSRAAEDEYRPSRAAEEDQYVRAADEYRRDDYRLAADEYRPARAADEEYRPAGRRSRRSAEEESRPGLAAAAAGAGYAERAEVPQPRGRRYADDDVYADEWSGRERTDSDSYPDGRYAPGPERSEPPVRSRTRQPRTDEPARSRWRADVPQPRSSRYADDQFDAPARGGRYADDDRYEVPQPRGRRYADEEPARGSRGRDRSDNAGAGYARHSRNDAFEPADPWADGRDDRPGPPPDDMPTLVDIAARRAMRADRSRGNGRAARRRRAYEDGMDEGYLRQLRGEAQ